ncbi:MAG: hypothetical protein ACD_22C00037G0002 [uncultured bacterium]|nr:MAG: hypothetical protein ACD_22C00037G0002 [uncultured bacterium]
MENRVDKLIKILVGSLLLRVGAGAKVKRILKGLEGVGGLWKLLKFVLDNEEIVEPAELIEKMPPEIQEVAKEIYMLTDEVETDEKNILEIALQLAREMIKEQRAELSKKRQLAEEKGEIEKEMEITMSLRDLDAKENKLFSLDFA